MTADDRPADADDEEIDRILNVYQAALAAGTAVNSLPVIDVPPHLEARVNRARACLIRLQQAGPRLKDGQTPLPPGQLSSGVISKEQLRIGRFAIVRELGRGGFGIVYLAYDKLLRREVALKVPRPEVLADAEMRKRFVREARIAAALDHPNLVPVLDVYDDGILCYLVTGYCRGTTLQAWLMERAEPVPTPSAVSLLAAIAEAVDHVHRKGILHRDIKPSNVLLESAAPTSAGAEVIDFVPRLTDFGLAKFLEGQTQHHTRTGIMLGTPAYMAPEQANSALGPVSYPTDIYALGVLLYELLTGQTPFRATTAADMLRQVLNDEPESPRRLRAELPRDLETICLKCLHKEPPQRYASAAALVDDLRHWQKSEPIRARPLGPAARVWRWCRRKPGLAAAAALAMALLTSTLAVGVGWAIYATQQANTLKDALRISERRRAENYLDRGLTEAERGEIGVGLQWMAHGLETDPNAKSDLDWAIRANVASWRRQLFALTSCIELPAMPESSPLAFSPDGATVWIVDEGKTQVRSWLPAEGRFSGAELPHPQPVSLLAVSSDGQRIATGSRRTARVWDASTRKVLWTFEETTGIRAMAFNPDGTSVFLATYETKGPYITATVFRELDAVSGESLGPCFHIPVQVGGFALGSDGLTLWSFSRTQKTIDRWEMPDGRLISRGFLHTGEISAIAVSHDGQTILTGSVDRKARLWDVASGRLLETLYQREPVSAVAFHSDRRTLLTASPVDAMRVWKGQAFLEPLQSYNQQDSVRALAVSPDGQMLAAGCDDCKVRIWRVTPAGLVLADALPHPSQPAFVEFASNSKFLVTATFLRNEALIWELNPRRIIGKVSHTRPVRKAAFSLDCTHVATASYDCTAGLLSLNEGPNAQPLMLRHNGPVMDVAFSPNGRVLLTASKDGTARRWDAVTGQPAGPPCQHPKGVEAVAVSPDGQWMLTGGTDGTAHIWDATTGAPVGPLLDHRFVVWLVAFSPDGRAMLTGSRDDTARVWDAVTGQSRGPPLRHAGPLRVATFSPDSKWILTASADATARLWDTATGRALGPPFVHRDVVWAGAVDPQKRWVATGSQDKTIRLWPAPRATEGTVAQVLLWTQVATGIELNAEGGVQILSPDAWQQRRQQLEEWERKQQP